MWYFLGRGWIPHDEGTLAQAAERVLHGELPHRDFIEGYTGGLNYVNAFAFRAFGIHLLAIRYVLFLAFLVWVPVFYYSATRILPTVGATAVTLIAVFWSVPNYPAAMPSWYNLFLATGGLAAFLAYIDSSRRKWLFVAGLLGGVSVLVKIHGLFFIAAGLLFILFHECEKPGSDRDETSSAAFQIAIGAVLSVAIIALLAIGISRRSWLDFYQFTVAGVAMVVVVGRKVFRVGKSSTAARAIVRSCVPYLAGIAIPLVAFAGYYAAHGALPELVRGVAFRPGRSGDGGALIPSAPFGLIAIAIATFVLIDVDRGRRRYSIVQNALGIAVVALVFVPRTALQLEGLVWSSLAEATPVAIPILSILLLRNENHLQRERFRSQAVLLGCVAAFCSLIQYPFAAQIYFSYSLPLLLLAVVATLREIPRVRKGALQGLTAVLVVFGALYIAPMPIPGLRGPIVREDTALLDLPRGGLRIGRDDAENYPIAVEVLRAHATSGVIYAGPDAPEVYFLAQLINPTPVFFDYQIRDSRFHEHLLQRFASLRVDVVALRRRVVHSPPLEATIQNELVAQFPNAREIGRFTIRWR